LRVLVPPSGKRPLSSAADREIFFDFSPFLRVNIFFLAAGACITLPDRAYDLNDVSRPQMDCDLLFSLLPHCAGSPPLRLPSNPPLVFIAFMPNLYVPLWQSFIL